MNLTERHIIKLNNELYPFLDDLCFKAKNLYNSTLYRIRQEWFANKKRFGAGKYIGYITIQKEFQNINQSDYRAIPPHASQQIMRVADQNFKAFFAALKAYNKCSVGFTGGPKLPRYLDKQGRFPIYCAFSNGINKTSLKKNGTIKIIGTDIELVRTKIKDYNSIKQVRIVPKGACIIIEIIYEIPDIAPLTDNGRYAAIDLGVDNLMTVTTNIKKEQPIIYSGKKVKSINHYYNKRNAKLRSTLNKVNKTQKSSKRLKRLSLKRELKISDYFHKVSKNLVNYLASRNINTLIIGNNQGWKQNTKLGKVNNQNFVQIPFYKLIQKLEYKCKLQGINLEVISEEYTSKASFLDLEKIKKCSDLKRRGKRISRGMYRTWKGRLINADVNGSFNILRKCKPNAFNGFTIGSDGILDVVIHPLVIKELD